MWLSHLVKCTVWIGKTILRTFRYKKSLFGDNILYYIWGLYQKLLLTYHMYANSNIAWVINESNKKDNFAIYQHI